MKETAVAERYSKALFLALQEGKSVPVETVFKQLAQVTRALGQNEKLQHMLENPLVRQEQKKELLKKNFPELNAVLARFLNLLISKKRLNLLSLILAKFEFMLEESKGRLKAYVRSAHPLDDKTQKELGRMLSGIFKKEIALEVSVQPDLVAGMVVKVGDQVLDNSLRTQLKNLSSRLMENYG